MLHKTNDNSEKSILINEKALSLLLTCIEAKNTDDALKIITNQASVLVGGKGGSVWLRSSEDRNKIILRWTYRPGGANKVGQSYYTNLLDGDGYYDGLTGWVFANGRPLCINDITDKAEISRYPKLKWNDKYGGFKRAKDKQKQKHFLAVPIFSCRVKNEVIGVLRIGSSKLPKPFDLKNLELLRIYSGFISGLLTNYLKREEEKNLIEKFFTIASLSDLELLLNEAAKIIPIVIDGSYCSIFLRDKKSQEGDLCLEATSAPHLQKYTRRNSNDKCLKYKIGLGKTGKVAETGKSILVSGNIDSEAVMSPAFCEDGTTSASFLCSPIKEQNSNPVGVIRVVRDLEFGGEFDKEDQSFLESFGQKLYACLTTHGYFPKGNCFVIMPFKQESANKIYKTLIKPTVERLDFICKREDEYPPFRLLSEEVISHIANSSFIIAEVTENNPNVYYELGIAHTLKKTVIILSQQEEIPSDLKQYKYVLYKDTIPGGDELIKALTSIINELKRQ